jgi:sugar lactone lactonase YvrE
MLVFSSRFQSMSAKWLARLALFAAIVAAIPVATADATVEIEVVIDYDPAAGELPEGLAVDKRGNVYLSLAPLGEIRKIERDGSESTLATIPLPPDTFPGVLGLAVDSRGTVYAAVSTADPAVTGVYKIKRDGAFSRLPGTEAIAFPNGVTLDKRGNIYVTDTAAGAVWRIPRRGGPAEQWFQSPLLEGDGSAGFGIPIGANGIAYRNKGLVVANSEGARLLHIRIERDGSAGEATVLADDPALYGADEIEFDKDGDIWVAVIFQSTIVRVSRSGAIDTIATAADGLDFPSSVAFGKKGAVWAVNFAIGPAGGPGPALLRLVVEDDEGEDEDREDDETGGRKREDNGRESKKREDD